jgi:hypothetical protein
MKRRWGIPLGLVATVTICAIAWRVAVPSEPSYQGKRLSVWLDELCKFDSFHQRSQGAEQIKAIRVIGTNAIPWLLREYRQEGSAWRWKLNQLLAKQPVFKYRFRDASDRIYRATSGFRALGEVAEPAIPQLLAMVEAKPGYVPGALAGIGRPAVPALHQCLANTRLYTNVLGVYAIIPGNTISDIFNATSLGLLSKSDTEVFLPAIQAWARQTTNTQAQTKAQFFLNNCHALPD